jgi:hypothetical protein
MPRFLVECYMPSAGGAFDEACRRARATEGARCVWSTHLPGDETALHLFEAASASELARAVRRAGLAHDRIVDAVEVTA